METPDSNEKQVPLGITSDTQISMAQKEHKRKYHRNYYHEHKTPMKCEHCAAEYVCISSLRKHQGKSAKCQVKRMAKYIESMEGSIHCLT